MRVLLLTVAVLLVAPASAQNHNAHYALTGATTETGVSGTAAMTYWLSPSTSQGSQYGILHELSFWENEGRPCQIGGSFWTAPEGFTTQAGNHKLTEVLNYGTYRDMGQDPEVGLDCEGTPRAKRTLQAEFPAPDGATLYVWGRSGAAAIHGVRVCTDGQDPAVRGVRALVSTLNEDGNGRVVRRPGLAQTFERRACRTWETAQRCPIGQVATRVKGHYMQNQLVGLSLMCRAVDIDSMSGGSLTIQRRN